MEGIEDEVAREVPLMLDVGTAVTWVLGVDVGPRGQLTPSGQEVTVITLVVNIIVVDSEMVTDGTGSTVGGCDGCPEKLGPGLGVANTVPFGEKTNRAESCTFPSS